MLNNTPEDEIIDEILSEQDEPATVDPITQEAIESLPSYHQYVRELRSESEGLTFGDY